MASGFDEGRILISSKRGSVTSDRSFCETTLYSSRTQKRKAALRANASSVLNSSPMMISEFGV